MVRSGVGGGCCSSFGGGWGTNASRPFGVRGVITMKMISSTSNTSISGVTFMLAFWPPLGPTAIAIMNLLYRYYAYRSGKLLAARRRRWRDRRWGKGARLLLFSQ